MDTVLELNRRLWGLFLDRQDFQHLLNHITRQFAYSTYTQGGPEYIKQDAGHGWDEKLFPSSDD